MQYPGEYRYSKEHEWAKVEGNKVKVGITHYAQGQLGDVVFVDLPKVGTKVKQMETFGVVESVKAVSDLYAPISGEVVEINEKLIDSPELVNKDPHISAWMIIIAMDDAKELDNLMNSTEYEKYIEEEKH